MKKSAVVIHTNRLELRLLQPCDAEIVVAYHKKNADHLADSGPKYSADFFELDRWRKVLESYVVEHERDQGLKLFICKQEPRVAEAENVKTVIGTVNFSNFVRRAAQFCHLGYGLDADQQGQGYMTEAVTAAVKYVFEELNMHRVMANYMPRNVKSGAVLKRVGFVEEGFAKNYLYINGAWQDHVLTSCTNDAWDPSRA